MVFDLSGVLQFATKLIALSTVTALIEALLPPRELFDAVRVGIGLWYLASIFSELSVILSGQGG